MDTENQLSKTIIDEDYMIKNVGWAIGSYCNANCTHCYSREVRKNGDLLTQEDIITVLDKLKKLNIRTINIGGNEPIFTHSFDIQDSLLPFLIREVKKRNITLGITTNGTTLLLLHQAFPEEFAMVDDWDVSLDSPFRYEHENNRGKGFYDIALKALEISSYSKKNCSIIYCLMCFNCTEKHAQALAELTNKYHVDLRINTLKPTRKELLKLEADAKQIHCFFRALSQSYIVKHNSDIATSVFKSDPLTHCPCGKYSFAISPKKNNTIKITPCVYLQNYGVGNLLKEDILPLLNTDIFQMFRKHELQKCPHCTEIKNCSGGCLAYVILTSQYGECDRRCPITHNCVKELAFIQLATGNKSHVHEDYLCTWIGENK